MPKMKMLLVCFLFITLACAALYTNLQREATSLAAAQDAKERKLAPLRAAYRGIYWDDAYEEWSTEHFDILVESTRVAAGELTNVNLLHFSTGPDFNRFFMKDDEASREAFGWHVC
jgi:hypothetical protein